ncbi:MAG: hypothetical protein AAB405_01985 [Patescibacteria group bacterium]
MNEFSKFLISSGTFLAAAIISSSSSSKFGLCGKDCGQCEIDLVCLENGGDCPSELVV